jgi:L-ascorbate metabolism protein UlaG (beta-lactamase superfamily)
MAYGDAWFWNNAGWSRFNLPKAPEYASKEAFAQYVRGKNPEAVFMLLTHDHGDHMGGPYAVGGHILAGEHGYHSRQSSAGCIDPFDSGVRVRRAHERAMKHAGKREVVDELAAAGEQSRVFHAADRRADHRSSSFNRSNHS